MIGCEWKTKGCCQIAKRDIRLIRIKETNIDNSKINTSNSEYAGSKASDRQYIDVRMFHKVQ